MSRASELVVHDRGRRRVRLSVHDLVELDHAGNRRWRRHANLEVGLKFRADTERLRVGRALLQGVDEHGHARRQLWASAGRCLATVTFSGETATGWQQVNFSSPVTVTAGTTYVVSYHATNGHYSFDAAYFANRSTTRRCTRSRRVERWERRVPVRRFGVSRPELQLGELLGRRCLQPEWRSW